MENKTKYEEPTLKKESFTCPHCNVLSLMEKDNHYFESDAIRHCGNGTYIRSNEVTICRCLNCGKKIIWVGTEYAYPDIIAEEANEDMPPSVKQLYDEAGLIYNKSPRAACALLRLAVDRLCNELGETDRDINKNIGELVKKGLPQDVQRALDVVRVVGNKAVHPGQIVFDVDDKSTAVILMRLLNMIVERMISEPKAIMALYKNLPETIRISIEKRDK